MNGLNDHYWSMEKSAKLMDVSLAQLRALILNEVISPDALLEIPGIGTFIRPSAVLELGSKIIMARMRFENRIALAESVVGIGFPVDPD